MTFSMPLTSEPLLPLQLSPFSSKNIKLKAIMICNFLQFNSKIFQLLTRFFQPIIKWSFECLPDSKFQLFYFLSLPLTVLFFSVKKIKKKWEKWIKNTKYRNILTRIKKANFLQNNYFFLLIIYFVNFSFFYFFILFYYYHYFFLFFFLKVFWKLFNF